MKIASDYLDTLLQVNLAELQLAIVGLVGLVSAVLGFLGKSLIIIEGRDKCETEKASGNIKKLGSCACYGRFIFCVRPLWSQFHKRL